MRHSELILVLPALSVLNLDADQLRILLLQSRSVIADLKLELQSASSSTAGPSHTQNHIPSSHHAYDLKSLAETPTLERFPEESLVYDLNDREDDQEDAERSARSSTPIPNLTINSPSSDPPSTAQPRDSSEDRIETLEPDPEPEPSRKKRPASILGLKRIPSSIVATTAALHAPSSTSNHPPSPSRNVSSSSIPPSTLGSNSHSPSTSRPTSPGFPVMLSTKTRKVSGVHTGSGRVIEELQTEVMGMKSGLERTKNDLRLSQRVIGQVSLRR